MDDSHWGESGGRVLNSTLHGTASVSAQFCYSIFFQPYLPNLQGNYIRIIFFIRPCLPHLKDLTSEFCYFIFSQPCLPTMSSQSSIILHVLFLFSVSRTFCSCWCWVERAGRFGPVHTWGLMFYWSRSYRADFSCWTRSYCTHIAHTDISYWNRSRRTHVAYWNRSCRTDISYWNRSHCTNVACWTRSCWTDIPYRTRS